MKKLFAFLTALSCIGSMLTAFPAAAKDSMKTFIVTAVANPDSPEAYILTSTDGWTYSVSSSNVAEYSDQEYFAVGDVIEFRNLGYASTAMAGTNSMSIGEMNTASDDSAIVKIDSIIENPEIQDFTYNEYYLYSETEEYHFFLDWVSDRFWQPDQFEYDFLQDGDTVSCYTYEGRPYIMINTTPEDLIFDVLVVSRTEDTYLLMDDYDMTYRVDAEILNSYLLTDFTPEFGDVLRLRNLDLPIAIDVSMSLTYDSVPEEVPDMPHTPAIAKHDKMNTFTRMYSVKFDVADFDDWKVTLTKDGQEYEFYTAWLDDSYQSGSFMQEEILYGEALYQQLNQQSVSFLTWNGKPAVPVTEESKDYVDYAYVVGVDNAESPQQIAVQKGSSQPIIFSMDELALYMTDAHVQVGDVLEFRNMIFTNGTALFSPSEDTPEDRPFTINVTGSLFDNPTQEFTLWGKSAQYTRIKNADGKQYNIYFLPDGFETAPAPDLFPLKQGDSLTCIVDENNIPIMLYQPQITPDGDANGDGKLSILDVITVNKAILGKIDLPSDRIPYIDFNGDGIPDSTDSLIMLQMIVGLV